MSGTGAKGGPSRGLSSGERRSTPVVLKLPHVTRVVTRFSLRPALRSHVPESARPVRRYTANEYPEGAVWNSGLCPSDRTTRGERAGGLERQGSDPPPSCTRAHAHVVYAGAHDLTNNRPCPAASRGETENAEWRNLFSSELRDSRGSAAKNCRHLGHRVSSRDLVSCCYDNGRCEKGCKRDARIDRIIIARHMSYFMESCGENESPRFFDICASVGLPSRVRWCDGINKQMSRNDSPWLP